MVNIVKTNANSEIGFPTLERYKEIYPSLLSNYLKEYKDNTEKRFVELQIEHYKTYCDEFINDPKNTFNKYAMERFNTSRLLVIEYLESKLKDFLGYVIKEAKADKGLDIDIKKINDSRNIEYFNLKYERDLVLYRLKNRGKSERDFIESKIEEINLRETESDRMWNLSDDDFYKELRKTKNIIYKNINWGDDEEKGKEWALKTFRKDFQPSEFENYNLTLYKQKFDSLTRPNSLLQSYANQGMNN